MKLFNDVISLALVCAAAFSLAACGGNTSNQTASEPTVTSISVAPASTPLTPGKTQALTVTATESSGATITISDGLTFTSDNTTIASVSAAGVVTAGNKAGTAHVAVTAVVGVNNVLTAATPASIVVTIPAPTVSSIALSPLIKTLTPGGTVQLTVTGTYSDNSTAVLPASGETFTSSNTAVATVSATGVLTVSSSAVKGATAKITAKDTATGLVTAAGNSTVITVSVVTPTLTSVALAPLTANVAPGGTVQLTVKGTYSDNSVAALAASGETFTSLSTGVATVSAAGLVTVAVGATIGQTAVISAKDNASGLSTLAGNSTTITVSAAGAGAGNVYSNGVLDTGVTFVPFSGSVNSPLPAPDLSTPFTDNTPALKVVVTNAVGAYSGGAWVANAPRDLRSFNAVTFWAKANQSQSTLKVQFGNDAGTGANVNYQVESIGLPLTTNWQQFVIPMPDPRNANGIDGLFSFADANNGYTFWLANVQYLQVPANVLGTGHVAGDGLQQVPLAGTPPRLAVAQGATYAVSPGPNSIIWTLGTAQLNGSPVVPLPNGGNLDNDAWRWFTLSSSTANAAVSADGVITGVSAGSALITGSLAGTADPGSGVPVSVTAPLQVPTTLAATPSKPAASVLALYDSGGEYTPLAAVNYNAFGDGTVSSYTIQGKQVYLDGPVNYQGWQFPNTNVTPYDTLHIDVWTPNTPQFSVQLVSNGGAHFTVNYTSSTILLNQWVSLDIPLASFTGVDLTQLFQFLFLDQTGGNQSGTFYVDNVYFYKAGSAPPPTAPAANAPTPTASAAIALFSSSPSAGAFTYALHPVDFWPNPNFCNGSAAQGTNGLVTLANAKQVYEYVFGAGYPNSCTAITFGDGENGGTANQLNATGKTRFHMDVWSPAPVALALQLANAANTGTTCGIAPESCGVYTATSIPASQWYSIDVALPGAFSGPPSTGTGALTGVNALDQLILSTTAAGTFYIDNIYLY